MVRVRFPSPAPVSRPKRVVLNTIQKLILGAAALLFATGAVLAVAQPGDLGDGDDDDTAAPAETTTTEPVDEGAGTTETTADGGAATTTTTAPPQSTTTTTTAAAGGGETTSTTRPSSGIGASGAGNVGDDIADTGHESMLAAGLALLSLGLAARRALRSA